MSIASYLRRTCIEFLSAVQFLTRIPMPSFPCEADSLARSVKFFPLVGALIGGVAALLHLFLSAHLPRLAAAFFVLLYSILVTGGLHEDGLADTADGFGGGRSREQTLLIMRDSRIGAYGGIALALSLIGRLLLIASLPFPYATHYLIAAAVLARWTVLPLSHYLPAARTPTSGQAEGQGARIARLTSTHSLIAGTLFSFGIVVLLLKTHSITPILTCIALASFTGLYYKRRIGGATGDCFGATLQLSELSVYLCGAWTL